MRRPAEAELCAVVKDPSVFTLTEPWFGMTSLSGVPLSEVESSSSILMSLRIPSLV
ncbi:hypothetical protein Scep_014821 [Stephania cephalantha]|uniref:Uncharacterized protein n=1 Tax=Stephania cephalantha TaxID=152367 RepID=A0AAP0J2R4_9MAGN